MRNFLYSNTSLQSTHDLYRETVTRNKSSGDLKGKETRRLPLEITVEHVSLGIRIELLLCTCIFPVDGRGESSVKPAIGALLKALCKRNIVPISLLSDGEGAIAICIDIMRSLGIRFNPVGPGQHVSTVERSIRTVKSMVRGILNNLPYNLPLRWLMYLVQFVVTRVNCMSMRQNHG